MRAAVAVLFTLGFAGVAHAGTVHCDPTRDTLSGCVSAATAATGPATVVLIPNSDTGAFPVAATVTLPSNVTIRCEPKASIQLSIGGKSLRQMLVAGRVHDIVIEGCVIDGNSGHVAGLALKNVSRVRIFHNVFKNFDAEALTGEGWTDVDIDGNEFSGAGASGKNDAAVYLFAENGEKGSRRIKVHNNTCNNLYQQSGCLKFAASHSHTISDISVFNNFLNVGNTPGADLLGIEFYATDADDRDVRHFVVSGNAVTSRSPSPRTWCISVSGREGEITNNRLSNCGAFGIEVLASDTNVLGNTLRNTGPVVWDGNAANHTRVLIAGNDTRSAVGSGAIQVIAGYRGAYTLRSASIRNNTIQSPGATAGILVQTISEGHVEGVVIEGNTFDAFSSSQRAIDTEGSPAEVRIENNSFVNIGGTGLFLNAGVDFSVRLNHFDGATWLSNFGATIARAAENTVNERCCH
jgi:Right handed beta helix region